MKLDYSRMVRSVTVELVRAGQPRAYADSEYEAYLTFSVPEGSGWASKLGQKEEQVLPYIPLFVHPFNPEKKSVWDKGNWWEPWLEKLEQVSPGRWHVIVKSPYLD